MLARPGGNSVASPHVPRRRGPAGPGVQRAPLPRNPGMHCESPRLPARAGSRHAARLPPGFGPRTPLVRGGPGSLNYESQHAARAAPRSPVTCRGPFWRLRVPACNADIRALRARHAVRHPGSEGGGRPAQVVAGLRGWGRGLGATWPVSARGRTPASWAPSRVGRQRTEEPGSRGGGEGERAAAGPSRYLGTTRSE